MVLGGGGAPPRGAQTVICRGLGDGPDDLKLFSPDSARATQARHAAEASSRTTIGAAQTSNELVFGNRNVKLRVQRSASEQPDRSLRRFLFFSMCGNGLSL